MVPVEATELDTKAKGQQQPKSPRLGKNMFTIKDWFSFTYESVHVLSM